jgi:hypothetical protein
MYAFSNLLFWVHLFTKFHCCYCGSREGYSSQRRNSFERLVLTWFRLRPVRCGTCFRRFYLPVSVPVRSRGQASSVSVSSAVEALTSSETMGADRRRE